MGNDRLNNKFLQTTEIPDRIIRKGNIIFSDKCCIATVDEYHIYWDGEHFKNTQEMKKIFFKYLTWEERGMEYMTV